MAKKWKIPTNNAQKIHINTNKIQLAEGTT